MLPSYIDFIDSLTAIAQEIALWGGVLLFLASGLSLYWGWKKRKLAAVIDDTPRKTVADVRSPGLVRVRGEITPQAEQDTFTSPINSDENCVLSAWEIKEMYDNPKTKSWERSAWGIKAVPFYLSNDGGETKIPVEVEDVVVGNNTDDVFTPETLLSAEGVAVEGLQCEFELFDVHLETEYGDRPPKQVADFLGETDGLSVDPMVTPVGDVVVDESKRKYLEQTLTSGDVVSILGYAEPRREGATATNQPADLVLSQSEKSTLRLSERPFDEMPNGSGAFIFSLLTGIVGIGLLTTQVVL